MENWQIIGENTATVVEVDKCADCPFNPFRGESGEGYSEDDGEPIG